MDNFILRIFCKQKVFSEIKHLLYSLNYQYALNFIPHFISVHEISFLVFGDCGQNNLNIQIRTETTFDIVLAWQKKLIPHILIIRVTNFKFEYISEFESIFEKILSSTQGTRRMILVKKKKQGVYENLLQEYR
jgi:hypothetical protein